MTSTWLPTWLALAWATAYAVILVPHVVHAVRMPGSSRWWHLSHVLMAAGMIDMALPGGLVVPARLWMLLFAIGALGALGAFVVRTSRSGRLAVLWAIVAVDLGAMVVMVRMMESRWLALSVALAVWFVLEAIGWATGPLIDVAAREMHTTPEAVESVLPPGQSADTREPTPAATAHLPHAVDERDGAVRTRTAETVSAAGGEHAHGHVLRVSLAVMSLGMAFMFLAMQFGMSMSGTMSGSMPT